MSVLTRVLAQPIRASRAICVSIAACIGFVVSNTDVSAEALVVGVRTDAPPFSYHENPGSLNSPLIGRPMTHGFDGYIVRICDAVLRELENTYDVNIESRIVNAQNRFQEIEKGRIHILCDPATIVPDRLENTLASIPIYMSAITYAAPDPLPPGDLNDDCWSVVGLVSETTATEGVRQILNRGSWPRFGPKIEKELKKVKLKPNTPLTEPHSGSQTCIQETIKRYKTHDELAKDFCQKYTLYYVGDIEIVRAKIEEHGCLDGTIIASAVYTNERYSIFTALPKESGEEIPSDLILIFLAELSRQVFNESHSLIVKIFEDLYGDKSINASEKLRVFFWSLTGDFPGKDR